MYLNIMLNLVNILLIYFHHPIKLTNIVDEINLLYMLVLFDV